MIRVERPAQAPEILHGDGQHEANRNRERYDEDAERYRAGTTRFDFDRDIYAHPSVKSALLAAQHRKCCYCESKFRGTSYGAVEHFRPKGAVRRRHGTLLLYPGYYWLAYEWENLLVSCEVCNTRKGTLFPLVDESTRARSHRDSVDEETPVFIDPANEDPAVHIQFRRAEVVRLTDRGLQTIKGLGLRRSELESAREEHLELLKALYAVTVELDDEVTPASVDAARALLNVKIRPEAEFSAMVRDFLDAQADGL